MMVNIPSVQYTPRPCSNYQGPIIRFFASSVQDCFLTMGLGFLRILRLRSLGVELRVSMFFLFFLGGGGSDPAS